MCRHCENLVEDKKIVHDFMCLAAERLSEKLNRNITADDIDVEIKGTITGKEPMGPESWSLRATKMLHEMSRPGF